MSQAVSELTPDQIKALDGLHQAISRLEKLWASDPDARHKESVRLFIEAHRGRFEAIRKEPFDQGKYDELAFDVGVELQRMMVWLSPPKTPPSAARAASRLLESLDPDPQSQTEIAAALKVADAEIQRLESNAAAQAQSTYLANIKRHRSELDGQFTKNGWEALVREIKAARQM